MSKTKTKIKSTIVYKKYCIWKNYADKMNITLPKAIVSCNIMYNDLFEILSSAKIKNVGCGDFFYSLDESIRVLSKNRIIDNIPIDYSFILENEIKDNVVRNAVDVFIKKVDDPRLSLLKPTTLKEALQSILLWNSILWQTGHRLVGLGRLDKVLDKYEIPENATDLICDFLKTLHANYEFKSNELKGDTGQIILVGGLDEDGVYFTNEYTYLLLACLKKVNLPDPKILVRVSRNMPKELLELAVDVIATGIGSPLLSNDDIIIPLLIAFGYEKKDAYNYGTSACWEPLSIGNSLEQNNLTNIRYGKCINETLRDNSFVNCKNIDEVINIFFDKLDIEIKSRIREVDFINWEKDALLTALMGLDKDISEGGAKYNNYGILSVGMSSAVNSLVNIEKWVFEKNRYTLQNVKDIIISNYKNGIDDFSENEFGFGTESRISIDFTNKIIHKTEELLKDYRNMFNGRIKFGLSSPSYITTSGDVGATLDGRKAGQPFETHISRDKCKSITEVINFESKLEFSPISANANVLDIMVQASLIKDNKDKFITYILGGIEQGFFQMQINVLAYTLLTDAKAHPERYPHLIVRVWGFSAYFNDLPEEYKDNLIRRAKEMEMVD